MCNIIANIFILGTWIGIGMYTIHHDPLVWDDPEVQIQNILYYKANTCSIFPCMKALLFINNRSLHRGP